MAAETIGYAIIAALVYSVVFFAKHRLKDKPESFDWQKLCATLIVGAVIGAIFYLGDLTITAEAVETQLIAYVSIVAIVESVIKIVIRAVERLR